MNRVLLIAEKESDLGNLLQRTLPCVALMSPDATSFPTDEYDALCVLAGNMNSALTPPAPLREAMEKMRKDGKPVFTEFVSSIGSVYLGSMLEATHHRMVFSDRTLSVSGLTTGDVLDGHKNDCINYVFRDKSAYPILAYHEYVCAHSHIEMDDETYQKGNFALWLLDPHTLICAFRLCNFRRARLVPHKSFEAIVTAVISFLAGEAVSPNFEAPVCMHYRQTVNGTQDTQEAISRGIAWFKNADMLRGGGTLGAYEGFAHRINASDGVQLKLVGGVRTDCSGETGGAYLFHGLLTGDAESLRLSEILFDFCFRYLQVKDGPHKGMLRWAEVAWETCYPDDAARVMLPLLLRQHFDGEIPHFSEIKEALDFMLKTTAPEGVHAMRLDLCTLNEDMRVMLTSAGGGLPCAHYNAFYHAALLLAYRAGGDKRYLDVAEKGLSHLMSLYPKTYRETSETEENCRLLFPLSVLYGITGKPEHYAWICRVAEYLEEHRHPLGAVAEWDTDYSSACSRNHTGECALLASNGDPVADLLYSNNWLPLGYAYAYMVTGEIRFFEAWCKTASFLLTAQIQSDDPRLDGAWARAFDLDAEEINGMPHDAGWAPACIESGWTVGEILMGLQFMHVAEKTVREK